MKMKLKEPIMIPVGEDDLVKVPKGTIFEFEECGETGQLNFDLSDIYQKQAFLCAVKGSELKNAIDTLYSDVFRPALKYGSFDDEPLSEDQVELIRKVWEKVSDHFSDVDFENLVD